MLLMYKEGKMKKEAGGKLAKDPVKGSRWVSWAWRLKHTFDVDGWACPWCEKKMVLRTVIIWPPVTDKVVLGLRGAAGVGHAARAPPEFEEEETS